MALNASKFEQQQFGTAGVERVNYGLFYIFLFTRYRRDGHFLHFKKLVDSDVR